MVIKLGAAETELRFVSRSGSGVWHEGPRIGVSFVERLDEILEAYAVHGNEVT